MKRWQKALIVLLTLVLIGGICGGFGSLLLVGRYEGKAHHADILGPIAALAGRRVAQRRKPEVSRAARPHHPMRPLWRCRACGAEWPCQPARLALLVEYRADRTALLVYLSTLMAEAGAQLSQLNGHALPRT